MPIYEFHCGKCDRDSEILLRSRDQKKVKCPHCGSLKLSRKFSVFAASNGSSDGAACEPGGGGGGGCCACAAGRPHKH
jgi:putative FmdB family regulatory protein